MIKHFKALTTETDNKDVSRYIFHATIWLPEVQHILSDILEA